MRKINLDKERELENTKVLNPETRDAQEKFYKSVETEIERHYENLCI
jgi:hypothetical protein